MTRCSHDRILIMGDFNYREVDYKSHIVEADTDSDANQFYIMTPDLFLFQHVTEETRKKEGIAASVLDYIFRDEEQVVEDLKYEAPLGKSDHVCLTWKYIVKVEENTAERRVLNY